MRVVGFEITGIAPISQMPLILERSIIEVFTHEDTSNVRFFCQAWHTGWEKSGWKPNKNLEIRRSLQVWENELIIRGIEDFSLHATPLKER